MKRLVLLIALCLFCACASKQIPERPDALGKEEISFSRKEPQTWTMKNGLVVYYLQDEDLPQISGTLYFPGGEYYQPAGRLGVSGLSGALMREGGITGMSPEDFDRKLDSLAASIESGFSEEYGTASFFCLEEDFEQVFSYFSEVVLRPAFSEKRLELLKNLSAKGIKARRDDPDTIAGASFQQLIYGPKSIYARMATSEQVNSITRKEIIAFHKKYLRPNGSYFAASGSLPAAEVKVALERHFASWQRNDLPSPVLEKIQQKIRPVIYLNKRDFEQARIYIGHRGPKRMPDDLHALLVFNQYFGQGSFASLLFSRIRSQLGLAYTVYGGLVPDDPEGSFEIYLATRVDQASRAIRQTLNLIKESAENLPDKESFLDAKTKLSRSFVFKFASPASIVQRAAMLKLLGYPETYDKNYLAKISAVDRADVLAVAKRYIDPSNLLVVVVGNLDKEQLEREFAGEFEVREFDFDEVPDFE